MTVQIGNKDLAAEISLRGGELFSLRDAAGTEYLWKGDTEIWRYRAANMFPYVGRLTEGRYTYRAVSYPMEIHGFLKDMDMELREKTKQRAVFGCRSDERTKETYPFSFELELEYELAENCLGITARVWNRGEKIMYFGLGSHPGFCIPWNGNGAFEEHFLEFDRAKMPVQVGMTGSCFTDRRGDKKLRLEEGRYLPLRHDLFDRDAVYVEGAGGRVFLRRRKRPGAILLEFPDMRYLGIWHKPHTDADYVCLEPFTSLPSRQDIVEALEDQPDLIRLGAGELYGNRWSIRVIRG